MASGTKTVGRAAFGRLCCLALGVVLLALTAPVPLAAQQRQIAPPQTPAAEPQAPAPDMTAHRPGLLDALGELFEKSTEMLSLKGAQQTIDAAKSAADNLTRLPGARMASGRTLCVIAANGAPDCVAAANALCRSQGFGGGASLATESGEKCPARVWLSGRQPRPGECRMETFVTGAMCQ